MSLSLDGSWERPGRSPTGAAVAGLLVCGALYTTLGGLFLGIVVAVVAPLTGSRLESDSFVDMLLSYYRVFQVPILAVTMVMELLLFFGLVTFLVSRWHSRQPFAYLSFRRPAAVDIILAGVGAVAIVPLAELVDSWSYIIFPTLKDLSGGESSLLAAGSPWQAVFVAAAVSLTPALCEETLFRGWLLGTLRRRLRPVPAIAIQAVLFSLFHVSPLSIVALALVGVYLGWLFDRCGTIFASMTAHAVYNGTIIVLVNIGSIPWLVSGSGSFSLPVVGVAVLALAACVLLLEASARRRQVLSPPSPTPGGPGSS